MEEPLITNGGGKSLNPFDDDMDSELLDISTGAWRENGLSQPVQQLESCWREIDGILSSKTMDPFAMDELKQHLSTVEKSLIKDHPESQGQTGPCLQYLLSENIIESIYMFSTRQKVYAQEIRILLLKFFTEVFTRSSQPILIHQQILRPISKLLRACEGPVGQEMTSALVSLLHTMCILMQENQSLLDLFFIESRVHMQSRFLVFTQLIPHMHVNGETGNRTRDALLLCLSLADQLPGSSLTHFIASDSNFCQVLATGLSGLYSGLPSTRDLVVDEWQSPVPVIEKAVPELRTFIQALDFCNSVLQMAPKVVCNTMLTLVQEGFLQQVMGPALLQKSESAVMFSTAYFTIFLTHISNVALMREFLSYLMQGKCDGRLILNSLLQNISSSNYLLCAVTLELFYVLLDLNCEDVMLELILKYLLPGLHVMPNQLAIIGAPDLYSQAARKFLQLLPASCIAAEKMFLESVKRSLVSPPERGEVLFSKSASPPPPPFLTASPVHGGHRLERPSPVHPVAASTTSPGSKAPLTNLPMLPPLRASTPPSLNPFDAPAPAPASLAMMHHPPQPRSRSGSDASSSSLVSMSSISSAPQVAATGPTSSTSGAEPGKAGKTGDLSAASVSSPSSSFQFEYVSQAKAYFNSLAVAREAINECANRCHCWSSIYDKCEVSKEMLLSQENSRKATGKSLEMEDMSSVRVQVTAVPAGGGGVENSNDLHSGPFRSRVATLAAVSSNLQHHDQLHSHSAVNSATAEDRETKMVAGACLSEHNTIQLPLSHGLRRSGTVSGGSRPQRNAGASRLSPRLDRKRLQSPSAQYEDKIGLFLKILMDKLMEMMQHPPTVNILLTRVISRLAHYPQPLLRSLLLNHQLVLKPGVPNLLTVLQFLKQTVDRYAKTQEGFEKRLGRARKTMVFRAQVRNSQTQESVARQIVSRQLLWQNSRTDLLEGSVTESPSSVPLVKNPSSAKLELGGKGSGSRGNKQTETSTGGGATGGKAQHSARKRNKKVSTDTLFAIVIFYEFLQELASISEEQSVMHSLLYLPKSTSL